MKIAVAGTGYVGLSISCLIAQHHTVCAVDLIKSKVDSINNRKSPIQDEYIEKYLAEKDLDLTATLDGETAYRDADFVVIAAPTNYDSKTQHFDTTLFMQDDLQYDGLTELIVTETITERKTEMIRRGDAFIAFPGGTGTLEEIAEVMSKVSLKQLDAPCILYNLNGYYNGLKTLLDHMIETGLSTKERQEGIWFAENLEQIKQILKA